MPTISPQRSDHTGFTLVEMSLVLVIIGIIMASVMKGRDIISSAQETHEKHVYFTKWITLTNDYLKATGEHLADGERNGGNETMPDGYVDGIYLNTGITTPEKDTRSRIKAALQTIGVDPCTLLKGNVYGDESTPLCNENFNPFAYQLANEFIGKTEVTMGFGSYGIVHADGRERKRNFLVFVNLPISHAKRLDATLDGSVDGASGSCLNFSQDGTDNTTLYTDIPVQGTVFAPTASGNKKLQNWPTDAGARNHLFQVGVMLD